MATRGNRRWLATQPQVAPAAASLPKNGYLRTTTSKSNVLHHRYEVNNVLHIYGMRLQHMVVPLRPLSAVRKEGFLASFASVL